MFKKIVVPLDGTPPAKRAIAPAKALADQAGVPIELLMGEVDRRAAWPREYLHHIGHSTNLGNYRVRAGPERIHDLLTEVTAESESLVCMTTHGRNYIQESFLGRHTAKELIAETDASFLVVGPRAELTPSWRADELFVCADGSTTARAIAPVAADWAKALDVAIRVINVAHPVVGADLGNVIAESSVRSIEEEIGDDKTSVDWEVLHGHHPASKIVGYADNTPNSVIAMATHGRIGPVYVAAGSVTNSVIRFAASPVLVVRPPRVPGQET